MSPSEAGAIVKDLIDIPNCLASSLIFSCFGLIGLGMWKVIDFAF